MTGYVISFDVGVRNLGVAASSVEPSGDATLLWMDTADITATCADRCVIRLWSYLDELVEHLAFPGKYTVLCERQPSKVCSLIRTVELAIRHYFLMRSHRDGHSVVVKSVSPRKKLSKPVVYRPGSSKGQQYKARKDAGVQEAIEAFAALPEVVAYLKTGKADDSADAALYHVQFFNARNFVAVSPDALRNARSRADVKAAGAAVKVAARQAKLDAKEAEVSAKRAARALAKELKFVSKLKVCLPHRDVLAAIAA